jgi:hypothetical protein
VRDLEQWVEGTVLREKQIDAMIEAGRQVLESDFDPKAFGAWKKSAALCVDALLRSDGSLDRDSSALPLRRRKDDPSDES